MSQSFDHPHDVLRFCQSRPDAALVIVTHVSGGALRSVGALMAVTDDAVAGYVSNGCVDADITAQARRGIGGAFTYGEGSPFRDIVLPCGGRIDIAMVPKPDAAVIEVLLTTLENRKVAKFSVTSDFQIAVKGEDVFQHIIAPKLRLRIAGRGEALLALTQLAQGAGLEVILQSPDQFESLESQHLTDPANIPSVNDDPRTAVICLFHDHDWEPQLLRQAVQGPAFYIGAMGSTRTHAQRRERLAGLGVSPAAIDKIKGPIGLLPAMRDANFLAVSILADVLAAARKGGLI